ncbi:MAG: hypothetical protein JST40_11080 [Armatimonadetes bacterium]|nr:hypothetical protein [Armatimonadota bacterium]
MHDPKDVEAVKLMRREFNKRHIDVSLCDLRVHHGIASIRGTVKPVPGAPDDLVEEMGHVVHILRNRPEIRDIAVDVVYRH